MEGEYKKEKKTSSIFKKLERCLSITKKASADHNYRANRVAPTGCLSVYVGPEKQRFVIKTEFVNHPLFKMLLEDAELEYGFTNKGPLLLPCEVGLFCKVLAEVDSCGDGDDDDGFFDDHYNRFSYSAGSCSPFNPTRRLGKNRSYHLQTPPRFIKINQF